MIIDGKATIGRMTIGRTTISRSQLVATTIGRYDNWSPRQLVAYLSLTKREIIVFFAT